MDPLTKKPAIRDPKPGILQCEKCAQLVNVKKFTPGQRIMCPRCQNVMTVPPAQEEAAPPTQKTEPKEKPAPEAPRKAEPPGQNAQPIFDPVRKVLTCPACQSQYRVAGYSPGRKILCVSCERILVVPAFEEPKAGNGAREPTAPVPEPPSQKRAGAVSPDSAPKDPAKTVGPTAESPSPAAAAARRSTTRSTSRNNAQAAEARSAPATGPGPAAAATGSADVILGGKKILTCRSCDASYNVTGIPTGRKILCLKCDTILEVTADLPVIADPEAAGFQIIELGKSDSSTVGLDKTRRVFREFHEREATRAVRRGVTDRTIRVSAEQLREMVDQDPSYQDRAGVAEKLAESAAVKPRRARKIEKSNAISKILLIGSAVIVLGGIIAFFAVDRGRKPLPSDVDVPPPPRPPSAIIGPEMGMVEAYGIVPGDATIHTEALIGTLLSVRDLSPAQIWIADETGKLKETLQKIDQERRQFEGRVCLKVVGRVKEVTKGMRLPEGADTTLYISAVEITTVGYDELEAIAEHLKALAK